MKLTRRKKFSSDELANMDFSAYLASDTDGSGLSDDDDDAPGGGHAGGGGAGASRAKPGKMSFRVLLR